ncbi:hydrogen peroxide-inducible genes activator [Limobrevibacterium gyesilva]|uniref:Hydrogen peroxide-inducible genes activator n=1 Tax=Limobrevibacterium gyesilva TaxID=2991712 RepID=A0AA41YJ04_9PROT|nr:hydrogen peroxide-inducible genes activator [Limobrevibacterium gyesilva]MCW3474524.1 hydrogen peroxide-inducible genes activator [Limobrevibacterium gyesilva]
MTLAELRYLVAAADLQHFSRAAERCRISQPTFSSQLRKLEDYLGVRLFERTTKAVTITPIGERVVAHARRIFEEVDQICELARHEQGTLTGVLRLGIIPTLGPYLLPLFLQHLHQAFPELRLILREGLTGNLLAALETYELDVLVIALPDRAGDLPSLPLFQEPFWFVCPATHPLAAKRVVAERDLARHRLLLLDEGHCLRAQALAVCGEQFREREPVPDDFRATSLETICEMVAAGLGCTLLPALAVPPLTARNPRLQVRPFEAAQAHRTVGLLWRASFPRSADLPALGTLIQQRLPASVNLILRGERQSAHRSVAATATPR